MSGTSGIQTSDISFIPSSSFGDLYISRKKPSSEKNASAWESKTTLTVELTFLSVRQLPEAKKLGSAEGGFFAEGQQWWHVPQEHVNTRCR